MARGTIARRLSSRLEIRMLALAVLIAVTLSVLSPYFLKTNNLLNLLDQSVVVGVVAIGMTFVILTGGIDLSVGSLLGVTAILFGRAAPHVGIAPAIIIGVLAGGAVGAFSGFLIARFGLAAFVVTLGVMAIGRSLAYIFSGATAISDLPPALGEIAYLPVFGIQLNVVILAALYLLAWLYLTYTKGGRTIYAIGSNKEAARTAGLDVLGYSVLPYAISGALSACCCRRRFCRWIRWRGRRSSWTRSRRWLWAGPASMAAAGRSPAR